MKPIPRIDMQELRRIADRQWDALATVGRTAAGSEDLDYFLATGAVMLWNGASDEIVGDYFVGVEVEQLGIDTGVGMRERGHYFAKAIRQYLEKLAGADLIAPAQADAE